MSTAAVKGQSGVTEDVFVDELMRITKKALANVPPDERKSRLDNLENYLTSLRRGEV